MAIVEVSNFNLQVVSLKQCLKRLNSISKSFVTKTLNLGRTFLIQLTCFVWISNGTPLIKYFYHVALVDGALIS